MTNELAVADEFPGTFKKIIKTDVDGTTIIYDASSHQRARIVGGIVVFLILSSFILSCSIVGIKKHLNKTQRQK